MLGLPGYRMPAEWEPHSATWLSFPRREGISFPDFYDEVIPALRELVAALCSSEKVCINVRDEAHELEVRGLLRPVLNDQVRFFRIPISEPWCRDHGPIFVTPEKTGGTSVPLAILDWGYNAWGGKYPPFDLDDKVPTEIGHALGLPVHSPGIVLEGGSIDVNGAGALLTTESCLLNPNRNPHLSKAEIESYLCGYLGVNQVIWLGDGIDGDDTDGHIDDLTRFVSRDTVVTVLEEDPTDINFRPLRENFERLCVQKLADGTPLKVVPLPMPRAVVQEGMRLPASYANFYIANRVVVLPVFDDPSDAIAVATLTRLFPDRKIVPINCRKLVWGLGTFHCLTQQQPLAGEL